MAIPYWNILLHGRFQLLPLWTQFLQVLSFANAYLSSLGSEYKLNSRNNIKGRFHVIPGSSSWISLKPFHPT